MLLCLVLCTPLINYLSMMLVASVAKYLLHYSGRLRDLGLDVMLAKRFYYFILFLFLLVAHIQCSTIFLMFGGSGALQHSLIVLVDFSLEIHLSMQDGHVKFVLAISSSTLNVSYVLV